MNRFKVKTLGRFNLTILKVNKSTNRELKFYKRFNPKSIAISSSNLLTQPRASSDTTNSSLLDLLKHKLPRLWNEIPLKGFGSSVVNLVAATRFHQYLIVDLVSADACGVRRLQNLSDLTRVTHKSSKSLQNIVRVFRLYWGVLDWNPKRLHGLGPNLKFYRI